MPTTILRGNATVITVTRQCGGVPKPIEADAVVTGQFYPEHCDNPCSPVITALADQEYANWPSGLIAFHLSEEDTATLSEPIAVLFITIIDPDGSAEEWSLRCQVILPVDLRGTALFPDRIQAIAALRQRIAISSGLLAGLAKLPEETLWNALQAAEADAERALRTFFSPVTIIPDSATEEEREAVKTSCARWIEEQGYDLERDYFTGDRWGYVQSRHVPIISIEKMTFVYPRPMVGFFDVPLDWLRIDKKYGQIQLVPGSNAGTAPLAFFAMGTISGGRNIPQMIVLRYTVGITDVTRRYPDLVDLVRRMALLRLLQMMFLPTSASISADGLSESQSIDLSKEMADIEKQLERLRQAIHGVQATFL